MEITELRGAPRLAPLLVRGALPLGSGGEEVPQRGYRLAAYEIERRNLLAYQRICGFAVDDRLPVTYPHVLGFPLQAKIMAAGDFPLPMAGLVHVENTVTAHRELTAADVLDITVTPGELLPHRKGRTIELLTTAEIGREVVWEGRSVYLARGEGDEAAPEGEPAPPVPTGPVAQVWRLKGDLGRRYAAVSGDVNPIHLHPITARAMGFPKAIAHGMWTYPRTLAALGARHAYAGASQVWFRKPVLLPASVGLVAESAGDGSVVAALVSPKDRKRVQLVLRTT